MSSHDTHPARTSRAATILFAALPFAVSLALYLVLRTLAYGAGGLAPSASGAGAGALGAVLLAGTLPLAMGDAAGSRAPARIALAVALSFFLFVDFSLLGVGLGTCSNDAPPPAGSPVDRFCNGPAFGVWQWGLLSVFPIVIAGFALRRGRPLNWPFALALVSAVGVLVALVCVLPR